MSEWFYDNGDKEIGPIDIDQVIELIQQETIGPTTIMWREGMSDWVPASETSINSIFKTNTYQEDDEMDGIMTLEDAPLTEQMHGQGFGLPGMEGPTHVKPAQSKEEIEKASVKDQVRNKAYDNALGGLIFIGIGYASYFIFIDFMGLETIILRGMFIVPTLFTVTGFIKSISSQKQMKESKNFKGRNMAIISYFLAMIFFAWVLINITIVIGKLLEII